MELNHALEFIRERRHGVLTTIKRDGRPQLSNIAFAVGDDDVIRVSITDSRAKSANARRDPRVSLHVTRDDFYAYAVIEGQAELSPVAADPDDATVDELVEYYRAVSGEHPDWDDFRRAMVADRRLVLRLQPERAYGMLPVPNG
jgi:PPOX class probable F420-dependent enzyme